MAKKKSIIPLRIIDLQGDGFHPLLEITVFGKSFTVVLDTGASKTAFDKTMLLDANKEVVLIVSDSLSTGLGTNTMVSSKVIIRDFKIGDFFVDELEVAVLDLSAINYAYKQLGHPEVLGVLGGDVLMKYNAVIDYGKKVLKLTT